MNPDPQTKDTAQAAAEEILQIIYGEDLRGCAVSVDRLASVIHTALEKSTDNIRDVAELYLKGFEAVQLLATPPTDGEALSAEDLRALLSDRLDKIRMLATKILHTTQTSAARAGENGSQTATSRN